MRSFVFGKKFRAAVLVVAFSSTFVPTTAAAPPRARTAAVEVAAIRDSVAAGWRDEVVRIVRVIKKKFGTVTSNSDSLTVPRP